MIACAICDEQMNEEGLVDRETGSAFHPACAAARLPQDVLALVVASAAAVLIPMVVVWAG